MSIALSQSLVFYWPVDELGMGGTIRKRVSGVRYGQVLGSYYLDGACPQLIVYWSTRRRFQNFVTKHYACRNSVRSSDGSIHGQFAPAVRWVVRNDPWLQ
jgi:hypothetical protein